MKGNATYFARRAREERDAASKASHPAAQKAHEELAERYEEFGMAMDTGKPRLSLVGCLKNRLSR